MKIIGNLTKKGLLFAGAFMLLTACGKEQSSPVILQPESLQMTEGKMESQQAGEQTQNTVDAADNVEVSSALCGNALVGLSTSGESKKTSGSGFIVELTEDAVYICTNQHVIQGADAWTITFADGTCAEGEKVGCSQVFDVGVVMVKRTEIVQETMATLKAVKVDLGEWVRARDEDTKNVPVRVYRVGEDGLTGDCLEGTIESFMTYFEYGNGLNHTKMDITLEKGDSGSAVFDENGNLVTMVTGETYANEKKPERWGIPLTALITSYKEITGRDWVSMF